VAVNSLEVPCGMDSCILSAEKISAESLSYSCARYMDLGLKANSRQLLAFFFFKFKKNNLSCSFAIICVIINSRKCFLKLFICARLFSKVGRFGTFPPHLDNLIQGRFLELLLPSMMNSVRGVGGPLTIATTLDCMSIMR